MKTYVYMDLAGNIRTKNSPHLFNYLNFYYVNKNNKKKKNYRALQD